MTDISCATWDTKEDKAMADEWAENEAGNPVQMGPELRAEFEKAMPEVEEELRRLDEEEAKSKEELEQQVEKAEHLDIKVDSEDYPKAVQAIPIRGFDASEKITDSEMRAVIREDLLMQVRQRFFSERVVPLEYEANREIRYVTGKDGEPKTDAVLGKTIRDRKTGEAKKIVINEHRFRDAVRLGLVKREEIQETSQERQSQDVRRAILSTCAHERRGHLFTLEMLSEEAKTKVVHLFYTVKEREAKFVTDYAKTDSGEYLAEGFGIYEVDPERVKENDPELYSLIQDVETECRRFVEISKNLILVRGERK